MTMKTDSHTQYTYAAKPYEKIGLKDKSCVISLIAGSSGGIITISFLDVVKSAMRILKACESDGRGGLEDQGLDWHIGVKGTLGA